MKGINEVIRKHCKNSEELRKIYMGEDFEYSKAVDLRKKQNIEYNKMLFFQKLKREMQK